MTDSPSPIRRAALIARQTLPAALMAMTEAAAWLEARGCAPVVEETSAQAAAVTERWPTVPRADLATNADVVIAFGGDGTLLDAARAVANSAGDAPLLGINLGRLGFLTEVGRDHMTSAFDALLAGRTHVETRLMLAGSIRRDVTNARRVVLNDIVITRGALSRMIEIDVRVDGEFVCHVKADGLIVSTATGSTAYNLSAGGPIVHPSLDALVLTPIAPHTLTNRPLVLPASAVIELYPRVEPQSDILATFDGQIGSPLASDDIVDVARAPRLLRLLHTSSRTHFDMLREKLKWGN